MNYVSHVCPRFRKLVFMVSFTDFAPCGTPMQLKTQKQMDSHGIIPTCRNNPVIHPLANYRVISDCRNSIDADWSREAPLFKLCLFLSFHAVGGQFWR